MSDFVKKQKTFVYLIQNHIAIPDIEIDIYHVFTSYLTKIRSTHHISANVIDQ